MFIVSYQYMRVTERSFSFWPHTYVRVPLKEAKFCLSYPYFL